MFQTNKKKFKLFKSFKYIYKAKKNIIDIFKYIFIDILVY